MVAGTRPFSSGEPRSRETVVAVPHSVNHESTNSIATKVEAASKANIQVLVVRTRNTRSAKRRSSAARYKKSAAGPTTATQRSPPRRRGGSPVPAPIRPHTRWHRGLIVSRSPPTAGARTQSAGARAIQRDSPRGRARPHLSPRLHRHDARGVGQLRFGSSGHGARPDDTGSPSVRVYAAAAQGTGRVPRRSSPEFDGLQRTLF